MCSIVADKICDFTQKKSKRNKTNRVDFCFIYREIQLNETNWNVSILGEMDMDCSVCCYACTRQSMFIIDEQSYV